MQLLCSVACGTPHAQGITVGWRGLQQLGLSLDRALEVCHRFRSLALPLEQRSAVDQSQWQVWVDAQQGRRVAPDRTHTGCPRCFQATPRSL